MLRRVLDGAMQFCRRFLPRTAHMSKPFRSSRYIDFNTGMVMTAPMDLKTTMSKPWTVAQKIDLFECRVEVWQFGVAAEILKQIEANQPPSIWSHAAYALVSVGFTYFEMIGKTLNPNSASSRTASEDFNVGFCKLTRNSGPGTPSTGTSFRVRRLRRTRRTQTSKWSSPSVIASETVCTT